MAWPIDLSAEGCDASGGASLKNGITGGGVGTVYIDEIRLTKP
jgi:hypothetical protein